MRRVVLPVVALLAALAASPLLASETATIAGSIKDITGGILPGASVTARNVGTGVARSAVSGGDGGYRIPALPPGPYEVTAELAGFASVRRAGITLSIGQEISLAFDLRPRSVAEEITITADAPVVETTNASVQTVVGRAQIDLLPLIGRDFQDLARLSAGAVVTSGQGTSFTGSRGRSNAFLIDGVDNSEDISGFRRQDYNLDAIQEFQVLVNNFKAEYGKASGGVISVLSRSGTNEFHGSAFTLFRNQDLIARDPFLAAGAAKDPFERLQYGGSLGGPIRKDRTHFFVSFDYEDRETTAITTRPFPAPGAVVSPAVQDFLRENGVPAFPDTSAGTQVRLVRPEFIRFPKLSARVDHALDNDQSLTLRVNFERDHEPSGQGGNIHDAQGGTSTGRSLYGSVSHKWIRAANHLNELYVQVGRSKNDFYAAYPNLTNIFVDEFSTANAYLGGPTNYPQGRTDTVLQIIDSYTINKPHSWRGSHVFKFGGDAKLFRSDSFFDSNFRGSYFFTTVANFLAGRPRRFTQNQGDTRLDRPNNIFGFYVQDDWSPSSKLTLNLGLRYDYETGKTDALKGVPTGSAACALTDACGQAGAGTSEDRNNVAPRLGFVWDPAGNGRTALHGGIGLYYDQVILNVQGNARFTPPKVVGIQIENPRFPDPTGGPTTALRPNISVIDSELVTPRNLNASLGLRREITGNIGVDATLVWNKGYDHVVIVNTNTIDPATRVRPNPSFTNVSFYTNRGEIEYKGLLLEVKRRMSRNHSWGVSYTLAKAENTSETIFTGIQDPRAIDRSVGPSDEDRRHVVAANAVARLPWGFDLGGVVEFRSERPLDVFVGGRDLNGDGITGDWPDGFSRNSQYELSTAEANRLRSEFGLAPITAFADNPRFWNVDLTLQKAVGLGSGRRVKLSFEVFNLLNHPNKSAPSSSITSSLFGQLTAIDTARGARPRSIQLTGQFDF